MFVCFATTVRGLESLLEDELKSLGAKETTIVNAGIEFSADMTTVMRINLHSRLASRVLIRLAYTGYRHEQDIYRLAHKIAWDEWFHVGHTIKVATSAIASPLKSLDYVTLTVKDAICDYFVAKVDARPSVDKGNPDMRIYTFLTQDSATIYLDTSGEALFKRGYRQMKLEAPMRENLAFGLIKLSGWQPEQPFYDPMCGSGTLAIEAISYGLNLAPGLNRQFAFEKFNNFNEQEFANLKQAAVAAIAHDQPLKIFISDINPRALEMARHNLENCQLAHHVTFSAGDVLKQAAPANSGVMLTNPPYGVRLDELDRLANFYPLLGNHFKQHFANWNCYLFSADLRLPKLIRLKPSKRTPVYNGALECRLFEFKIVSGSNR